MEKIKAILIDDELNSLQHLQQKLTGFCPDVDIIAISQTEARKIKSPFQLLKELNSSL